MPIAYAYAYARWLVSFLGRRRRRGTFSLLEVGRHQRHRRTQHRNNAHTHSTPHTDMFRQVTRAVCAQAAKRATRQAANQRAATVTTLARSNNKRTKTQNNNQRDTQQRGTI